MDHICHSFTLFDTLQKIKPIIVTLSNAHKTLAKLCGIIVLSLTFILTNVLFLPEFSFNLISMSKLCQNSNCLAGFSFENFQLQNMKSKKIIGLAKQVGGLYFLKT